MISSVRQAYNEFFTEARYRSFLEDLDKRFKKPVTFRVAETPVFIGTAFRDQLLKASEEIIEFLIRPDLKKLTQAAIPRSLNVPNETDHSLFLALDFAVVMTDTGLEPRLIEMQGFPSLFGWQDVLSQKYREHFRVPALWQSHFGLTSEAYHEEIKNVLLNGHDPAHVILLEIDPMKQNTAVDFLATREMTGIEPVHIGDVIREGRKLYYMKAEKKTEIRRIYNRVIFDELVRRQDLKMSFNLTEEVDVEWAGHPNWFFRISKFTMPLIQSRYIPECRFMSEYDKFPSDLENYVLKPLFSFSGSGVVYHVTPADLIAVPEDQMYNYMLQKKVAYQPVIQAPDGMVKSEIRLLFVWREHESRPTLVTNLARLSRGEMIGVKYNKDKTWVGGSVCFFEP